MLALEPKILHISCYGRTTPEEALLFEKPGGEGLAVKKDDLQPLFEKIKRKQDDKVIDFIDLIFLTASSDDFQGRMFFEFGIQHVVCVRTGDESNSKAA